MSLPTEQHFILKEDGKIYWIEKMPEYPRKSFAAAHYISAEMEYQCAVLEHNEALQSAIDSAVVVSNQQEVIDAVFKSDILPKDEHERKEWKIGAVYSLLCSVEKKSTPCPDRDYKCADGCWGSNTGCRFPTVTALVTFSKPERKELLSDLMKTDQEYGMYDQPEEKETQEELWKEMQDLYRSVRDMHGIQYVTPVLMEKFTITRKK